MLHVNPALDPERLIRGLVASMTKEVPHEISEESLNKNIAILRENPAAARDSLCAAFPSLIDREPSSGDVFAISLDKEGRMKIDKINIIKPNAKVKAILSKANAVVGTAEELLSIMLPMHLMWQIVDRALIEEQNIRQKPKRINFSLTPSVREDFEETAAKRGISLSEFLRRAGFAAKNDPSILDRPDAVEAEAAYKASLGPSRWTRDHG